MRIYQLFFSELMIEIKNKTFAIFEEIGSFFDKISFDFVYKTRILSYLFVLKFFSKLASVFVQPVMR